MDLGTKIGPCNPIHRILRAKPAPIYLFARITKRIAWMRLLPAVATMLVGASGTVAGVTAAEAAEATELPTALVATTVKV
jgi:hypothetical protein